MKLLMDFSKKIRKVILAVDFKNIKHEDLIVRKDIKPINSNLMIWIQMNLNSIMTILLGRTRNFKIRSLGLSPDFEGS